MKIHTKNRVKRFAALAASLLMSMTAFADTAFNTHAEEDTIAGLDQKAADNGNAISSAQNDLGSLEAKQAELDAQIAATEGDISKEEEHRKALSEQIFVVEETLHALADSVTELETQIAVTEADIDVRQADIDVKKREISDGVEELKKRLRVMYIAGSNTYTDILVGASDFYDILMKLELIKRVADHDNAAIDVLIGMKDEYEEDETELNVQKGVLEDDLAELQQRRTQQIAQMEKLEVLYGESESSLKQLNSDKANYEANREQIEKEHEQFENELQALFEQQQAIAKAKKDEEERLAKLEEEKAKKEAEEKAKEEAEAAERKKAEEELDSAAASATEIEIDSDSPPEIIGHENDPEPEDDSSEAEQPAESVSDGGKDNDKPAQNDDNSSNTNTSDGGDPNAAYGYTPKSRFTWPVPGYYHISYGVGWRWGAYHKGIDIWSEGIRGNNIIAADAGTVILVSNTCTHDYGKNGSCGCGGGYGNYCIIDHGDGYWTLYGHSEGITVEQGQYVEKGDVLGTVGSTGYSTGPHLHFEVRINNEAQNPEDYV